MKKLAIVLSCLLLLVGGGVLLWQKLYPSYVYRYKLTINVETPNGIKSGSSVYEIQTVTIPRWLSFSGKTDSVRVIGDAVYVDVGDGKNLFGLITDSFETLAPKIVLGENTIHGMSRVEMAKALQNSNAEKITLPRLNAPPMVTFKEMDSPESAELVSGTQNGEIVDRASITLGAGYSVGGVTLQMTSDLPDSDILSKLPWLNHPERPVEKAWKKMNFVDGTMGVAPEYLFLKLERKQ